MKPNNNKRTTKEQEEEKKLNDPQKITLLSSYEIHEKVKGELINITLG